MACGLLWLLDSGLNISMQPFRAFIADITPTYQHNLGYSILTAIIGIGACLAFYSPQVINYFFTSHHLASSTTQIPSSIKIIFLYWRNYNYCY